MGWMTWERFRCIVDCDADPDNCISEKLIQQHIDIISQKEWREAGYQYVNIDDCWASLARTSDGKLQGNTTRFPSGLKALGDYAKDAGVLLGTYNDMGTSTCGGYPGECTDQQCTLPGYMDVDAQTYAEWGFNSLKMDGCNSIHTPEILNPAYIFLGEQLNKTGTPFLYSCSWPDYLRVAKYDVNYTLVGEHCNIWRMYNDIEDSWASVTNIVDWVADNQDELIAAAGPGRFNDPDMLIIGNFGLSYEQSKAQMALWSIMAAPLLMGNDLRNLDPAMKDILLAREVIAVNQDPLGIQGRRVSHRRLEGAQDDVWVRQLAHEEIAVALWNRNTEGTHRPLTLHWADAGLKPGTQYKVRELFGGIDQGVFADNFTAFVNPHGVVMIKLTPQ